MTLGAGLLLRRVAGQLAGVLVLPAGFALVIVIAGFTTWHSATAEWTTPIVVAVAAAGFVAAGLKRFRPRLETAPAALALVVFGLYAAPVVLSEEATFAGYTQLDDNAVHYTLIDHVMEHGRGLDGLDEVPHSSHKASLTSYVESAYPVGAHLPLGAVRPLIGTDVAWVFQPYLAFLMALTALAAYALLHTVVANRWLRAGAAFLVVSSGLVYAHALQGSVKELGTVYALFLVAGLVATQWEPRGFMRRTIPLAVAAAAGFMILNLAVVPWLLPLLALFAGREGLALWRSGRLPAPTRLFLPLGLLLVLAAPVLAGADEFLDVSTAVLTKSTDLGHLLRPLDDRQILGVWPSGDYRMGFNDGARLAQALMLFVALAALAGAAVAVARRLVVPLAVLGTGVAAVVYLTARGSPYADAKVMMVASPVVMVAAAIAAGEAARRHLTRGWLLLAPIAAGVLWTNAEAYHALNLAPRERFEELGDVGERLAGEGRTLITEWEAYGKYFLRGAQPESEPEAEWRYRTPELRRLGDGKFPADTDHLTLSYVLGFDSIVLPRSPTASRPPAGFTRTWKGTYYETWQRELHPRVTAHMPLGSRFQPGARPNCRTLSRLAGTAPPGARLAYVKRPVLPVFLVSEIPAPPDWYPDGFDPLTLRPIGPGRIESPFRIPRTQRWSAWLQGSFGRGYTLEINGERVGSVSYELANPGRYARLGEVALSRGVHQVALVRPSGDLRPGNGEGHRRLGPLVFAPTGEPEPAVRTIAPSAHRRLCAKNLDWVEVVREPGAIREL